MVNAYSNCDEVELFLNDRSLGSKAKNGDDSPRTWQVTFAPGTLRAVGRNKGMQAATDELKTAGAPARIKLAPEQSTLPHDGDHVVYVRACVTDAAGIPVTTAKNALRFSISGPGELIATDNASPIDHTPFTSPERAALRGTCVAIVRANADSGAITINATSDGLEQGSSVIQATPGTK
jgi:beta-galactosidase